MTLTLNADVAIGEGDVVDPGGRLGLSATNPRYGGDVNGTTLYYLPDVRDQIEIWDGAAWQRRTFAATAYTPAWTNLAVYDVFGTWVAGAFALDRQIWQSNTVRGATAALVRQNGRLVLGSDHTKLYLGTVSVASGAKLWDQDTSRCVVNRYNQIQKRLLYRYSSVAWSLSSLAWRAVNAASGYYVEYCQAFTDEETAYVVHHATGRPGTAGGVYAGVGDTSVTANAAQASGANFINTQFITYQALYAFRGQEGYHYFSALERVFSAGTATVSADPTADAVDALVGHCVC